MKATRPSEQTHLRWEGELTCKRCSAKLECSQTDLQVGGYKKPGTYWFDGSAYAVGIDRRIFVRCPVCHEDNFVDNGERVEQTFPPVPTALIRELLTVGENAREDESWRPTFESGLEARLDSRYRCPICPHIGAWISFPQHFELEHKLKVDL